MSSPGQPAIAVPPGRSVYLDTSALIKLYLPEPLSEALERALRGRRDLVVSDLAVTEMVSAISRRRREGALSSDAAARLHQTVLQHLEEDRYIRAQLTSEVHRSAERFLLSLAAVPLRAADALHLALASAAEAGTMATFDQRLAEAARQAGLQNAIFL